MPQPIIINKDNFIEEVIKSPLPVLVDFWAEWCGPCRMLIPIIDEASEKFTGKIKVAKINVNDEINAEIAEKYEIQGIPALKVFQDGKVVKELTGYRPFETLEQELSEYLK